MFPRGLILAVALGVISGPLFGIFLYEFGTEEQLVYVDGTSVSIVTEKTDFKLGESITIKIVNSGTDELEFPDTSYGLVVKQLDSIPVYSPISSQIISKLESHDEVDFVWNQLKNDGTQILEGTYKISVKAISIDEEIIEKIVTIDILK
mgnify:FL=1|jgi:hypothetical protein|tara:strand:- start:74 stop:520 length:447 start_codon:yes stop_codon:yes gene_type:complete